MKDDELRENAPWLVILLTIGVAIITMLLTLWLNERSELEMVPGPVFADKAAPPAPRPQPTSAPPPQAPTPSAPAAPVVAEPVPAAPALPAEPARPADPRPSERPADPLPKGESPSADGGLSEGEKGVLDELGGLTKPKEQKSFGLSRSLWMNVMPRLAKHPRILGFLLNNKYVVAGYLSRSKSKEVLSSPKAMAAYLSDATKPEFAVVHQMIRQNPSIAGVMAGSELSARIIESPGMQGLLKSGGAGVSMVNNPELMSLLTDPRVVQGLAAHANSAVLLGGIQGGSRRRQ